MDAAENKQTNKNFGQKPLVKYRIIGAVIIFAAILFVYLILAATTYAVIMRNHVIDAVHPLTTFKEKITVNLLTHESVNKRDLNLDINSIVNEIQKNTNKRIETSENKHNLSIIVFSGSDAMIEILEHFEHDFSSKKVRKTSKCMNLYYPDGKKLSSAVALIDVEYIDKCIPTYIYTSMAVFYYEQHDENSAKLGCIARNAAYTVFDSQYHYMSHTEYYLDSFVYFFKYLPANIGCILHVADVTS